MKMVKNIKRITAFLLCAIICLASVPALSLSASAEETGLKKDEFVFAPHTYLDGDLTDIYYYTDEMFSGSALDYNEHLATMSMILAAASISSQDHDATYETKSRNLSALLDDIDFVRFETNEYYRQKPQEQTMGVAMAFKVIGEGEDAYTLLAIVPRSAGYEKEWAGNFTVGKEGLHEGFRTGRDIILEFAEEYCEKNSDDFVGEVKIWTVGYSRGAGVANLLAAYLDDNSDCLGFEVKKENIFAYTFGTPSNVQYANEAEKAALENNYKNIHNVYSDYDIVTFAPFKNWNFTYYGNTKLFDVYNKERREQMLYFLEWTNELIYDIYTAEGSSADPDNFLAVMPVLVDGSFDFVRAKQEYGIPGNQRDFLTERIGFLVENLVPDRKTYVDGGYQHALQRLTSLYFGLNASQSAELMSGMMHDGPLLAASYYAYFLSHFYLDKEMAEEVIEVIAETLLTLEGYVSAYAAGPVPAGSEEWYAYVGEFIGSQDYEILKMTLELVLENPDLLSENVKGITQTIRDLAVGMTAKVLGSGVMAVTMDEEEKTRIFEDMTSEEVASPLTEFIVYLLLGHEEAAGISPFDPSNKSLAIAATFVYNAGRYMRVHNNEIILSWLRTEDSYYENEDFHIHAYDLKYDRMSHWHECDCGDIENNADHDFSDWKMIGVYNNTEERYVRRCDCGFEEHKTVIVADNSELAGAIVNPYDSNDTTTLVIVSIVSFLIIASLVIMIVFMKKRRTNC